MCFVIQTAAQRDVDEMMIAIHPRHARFYKRQLGFRLICSDIRSYETVQGNPAVLLSLDVRNLQSNDPATHARIFRHALPSDLVHRRTILESTRRHFRYALQPSSVAVA
jgi:hypothetical protein